VTERQDTTSRAVVSAVVVTLCLLCVLVTFTCAVLVMSLTERMVRVEERQSTMSGQLTTMTTERDMRLREWKESMSDHRLSETMDVVRETVESAVKSARETRP
jgi:cell division protein FtsX